MFVMKIDEEEISLVNGNGNGMNKRNEELQMSVEEEKGVLGCGGGTIIKEKEKVVLGGGGGTVIKEKGKLERNKQSQPHEMDKSTSVFFPKEVFVNDDNVVEKEKNPKQNKKSQLQMNKSLIIEEKQNLKYQKSSKSLSENVKKKKNKKKEKQKQKIKKKRKRKKKTKKKMCKRGRGQSKP
jgi:hypothetical protein